MTEWTAYLNTGWNRPERRIRVIYIHIWKCFLASLLTQLLKDLLVIQETACKSGDAVSISGLGRSFGGRNDNPFQYCSLGNPIDRGTWWATVHGGCKRVGHDLATKQQWLCCSVFNGLFHSLIFVYLGIWITSPWAGSMCFGWQQRPWLRLLFTTAYL